ncbi:class F sortase [Candidatus Saccharibacteria bacterium]|nr:class F sortase [Candidatus Saccharibacteria bacterium]
MDLVKKQKHIVHGELCNHRSYQPKSDKRQASRTYKPAYIQPKKVACMDIWSTASTQSAVAPVKPEVQAVGRPIARVTTAPAQQVVVSDIVPNRPVPKPVASNPDISQTNQTVRKDVQHIIASIDRGSSESGLAKVDKTPQPRRFSLANSLLYSMAILVFVVGLVASIHSFLVDKQVVQTVSAQQTEARIGEDVVDESEPSEEEVNNYTVNPDMPRYVTIEKLAKRAMVKSVGVKSDGSLEAPASVHTAGWYNQSAKPGSPGGATVLDGHVSGPTVKGVFHGIDKLQAGDTVTVQMGNGSKIDYEVVRSVVSKAEEVDMPKLLISVEPGAHGLNLITCTGKFDSSTNSYPDRIVVYTKFVRTY